MASLAERSRGAHTEQTEDDAKRGLVVAAGSRVILRLQPRRYGCVSAFVRVEAVPTPRRIRRLAWFPQGRGWQLDCPRNELSALRATCRELRQFLEVHTQLGRINRQEAVSMLPPLLLRVRPGQAVLDLCAAPGSKTVLLLSQLAGGGGGDAEAGGSGGARGGCVVANDLNPMRCSKLRVRMGRSRVPGAVVTCHPAQLFPGDAACFDRVLCDVPCSGDGTLRKNPDIWGSWQPMFSASLHPLQVAILTRGLQLLRPGGYLVYSTCSFSPVEDEAVVAAVLRGGGDPRGAAAACGGDIELVEINGALPGLRSEPGRCTWNVTAAADGSGVGKIEEVSEEVRAAWRLEPSLFPPPPDVAAALHLERTMRLLPHHNDTGGFFVALFRKADTAAVTSEMGAAAGGGRGGTAAAAVAAAGTALSAPPTAATSLAPASDADEAILAMVESIDDDDGDDAGAAAPVRERDAPLPPPPTAARDASATPGGGGGGTAQAPRWVAQLHAHRRGGDLAAELREFYGLRPSFDAGLLLSAYRHTTSRRLYLTSRPRRVSSARPLPCACWRRVSRSLNAMSLWECRAASASCKRARSTCCHTWAGVSYERRHARWRRCWRRSRSSCRWRRRRASRVHSGRNATTKGRRCRGSRSCAPSSRASRQTGRASSHATTATARAQRARAPRWSS